MTIQSTQRSDAGTHHGDGRAMLISLAQQLENSVPPHMILSTVCKTVVRALLVTQAMITLRQSDGDDYDMAAQYRHENNALHPAQNGIKSHSYPITHRGETIGQLIIVPAAETPPLTAEDERLLADIAMHTGAAAHVVRITRDLQRARERLVLAREEERRKLRRNLHDAVGPTLTAVMLKMGVLRERVRQDPATEAMVVELREQIRGIVTQIRHVIYDLRPPALEELGLLTTIVEQAQQFSAGDLLVMVHAPELLPPLPAAVEVATYRIVTEALNNVAKHSHATRCDVQLRVADYLYIDVSDNGIGLPDRLQPGVGIHSIRERVAELGGTCTFKNIGHAGTHVSVRLPMFLTPEVDSLNANGNRTGAQPIVVAATGEVARDPGMAIKVMLVDDHRLFREGVRNALKSAQDIQIVGEASNGSEALEQAVLRQPQVVLMDLQMPGLSGIETTQRLLRVVPGAGVVILTMVEDTDSLLAAMRAGARGYILKDADENELLRSIRAVANGEALFGPAVTRRLLQYVTHVEPASARQAFPELTEREREVLALMAQGLSNDDAANKLGVSVKTVRNQVSSILSKLQVSDRDEAINRARAAGLAS